MTAYKLMTPEQRSAEYAKVSAHYEELKARGLKLNMARGKPGTAQLDLVSDIFDLMHDPADYISDGIDVRNYGEMSGIPAAKRLFAEILGCKPEQVFVGGNASLQLMYDTIAKAYTHGLLHSPKPWCKEETVKWLCPAPGRFDAWTWKDAGTQDVCEDIGCKLFLGCERRFDSAGNDYGMWYAYGERTSTLFRREGRGS